MRLTNISYDRAIFQQYTSMAVITDRNHDMTSIICSGASEMTQSWTVASPGCVSRWSWRPPAGNQKERTATGMEGGAEKQKHQGENKNKHRHQESLKRRVRATWGSPPYGENGSWCVTNSPTGATAPTALNMEEQKREIGGEARG